MNFKPMLASDVDLPTLRYPVIASPKLDGFRATFLDGQLVTRSLKPFKNREINRIFRCDFPLDGELIVGHPGMPNVFTETSKIVTAYDADASDVNFYVFDMVMDGVQFIDRFKAAMNTVAVGGSRYIGVPHITVRSEDELLDLEEKTLAEGYEGIMLRSPTGPYKQGRSTQQEGYLLKLKRKMTGTALIIGYEEQMHNANEAKINLLGHTERSSHQANKVPTGKLGALVVRDIQTKVEFNIGTGFDDSLRVSLWEDREKLPGLFVEYEALPTVKNKPRHPVFKAFRVKEDISE